MIYNDFKGKKLSQLGFGAMRLPVKANGAIDEEQTGEMIDLAIDWGINYFDTAYPYHGGRSERVIVSLLSEFPRDSYYLADKFPGHQIYEDYDPAAFFEEQLKKCCVDYFDFYLLHNVCELSMHVYEDKRWKIMDYLLEQQRQGRIRHLGFSSHARPDTLRYFLDKYGDKLEFCQIQLNYLDWTLQDAKQKCDILKEYEMPLWVMEPVRGGKLAKLPQETEAKMKALRPEESVAAWAFRWLQGLPQVKMILSGMSSLEQLQDNLETFRTSRPLNEEEKRVIQEAVTKLQDSVPCTACRYCCDGCPAGLNIPQLLHLYNEARVEMVVAVTMAVDALPEDKRPSACVNCGACAKSCPQQIDVPGAMRDFAERLGKVPSWREICRQRNEENRRNQGLSAPTA